MYLISGEVLFDCFVDDGAGPDQAHIHAVAGGSPFNVARGIAKLGGKAAFFGGVSTDSLGRKIRRLLESEGVDTEYVIDVEASTPLSIVGAGPDGSPSYVFYNRGTAECSLTPRSIPAIDERITGLHFGIVHAGGGADRRRPGHAGVGPARSLHLGGPERAPRHRPADAGVAAAGGGHGGAREPGQGQPRGPRPPVPLGSRGRDRATLAGYRGRPLPIW